MSKPISFPLLEITTLIVVLFACVLVVVPGFDEFTTNMLLAPQDSTQPDSLVESDANLMHDAASTPIVDQVVQKKSLDEQVTIEPLRIDYSDGLAGDVDRQAVELDASDDMLTEAPESSTLDELVIDESNASELEHFSTLESSSVLEIDQPFAQDVATTETGTDGIALERPADHLTPNAYDEPALEAIEETNQLDLPEEPSQDWVSQALQQESSKSENRSTGEFDGSLRQPSMPEQESLISGEQSSLASQSEETLPVVINQIGGVAEVQTPPKFIRVGEMFASDLRVVPNPTFSQKTATTSEKAVGKESSMFQPFDNNDNSVSPSQQPYQLRTSALPAMPESDDNYFVPKR